MQVAGGGVACYYGKQGGDSVRIMDVLISGCTFLANDAKVRLPVCKSLRNDASCWLQDGAHLRAINTALTVSHCQFTSSVSHAMLSSISKTTFLTSCCLHYLYSLFNRRVYSILATGINQVFWEIDDSSARHRGSFREVSH